MWLKCDNLWWSKKKTLNQTPLLLDLANVQWDQMNLSMVLLENVEKENVERGKYRKKMKRGKYRKGKYRRGKRRNDKYTEWLISDETQYFFDFFLIHDWLGFVLYHTC